MNRYDLHCHMLPGIDDGPERLEDALAMAQVAAADGTRVVVATPHGSQVEEQGGREALIQRIALFNHELHAQGTELEVAVGTEYLLNLELLEIVERGKAICLNGSHYVLVEIDFFQYPNYVEQAMFQMQVLGFTPVLAHPERQATIQRKPDLLARLVERGVISQITGGSLLGQFGREARKSAEQLLKRNLVHLLASDGHSPGPYRPPVLSEAIRSLERLVGEEATQLLSQENPYAIAHDWKVRLPEPKPRRRKFPRLGRR